MWRFEVVLIFVVFVAATLGEPGRNAYCNKDNCKLPECFCGGSDVPGDLKVSEIPQFVVLTFDDSVTPLNFPFYERLLHDNPYGGGKQTRRRNSAGCPVVATFFIDGRNTKYNLVRQLYGNGSEIASHTRGHQ